MTPILFKYIKLYRPNEDGELPEGVEPPDRPVEEYDQYPATVDLTEVEGIEPSKVDRHRVTTLLMKTGYRYLALISYESMHDAWVSGLKKAANDVLLTYKQ